MASDFGIRHSRLADAIYRQFFNGMLSNPPCGNITVTGFSYSHAIKNNIFNIYYYFFLHSSTNHLKRKD